MSSTTVFVTTIGDTANFEDCMEHLRVQTVQRPVEIIDHVAPMAAAFQQMHERCLSPFYIQVDEDMILFDDAVARLEGQMLRSPENVAMICAPLWDCDTEQAIYGIKIYRHDIVRHFPYIDSLSCETEQLGRIKGSGFVANLLPLADRAACFGEHGKHYTPETIFKRWQRIFQKHEQLGHRDWIEPWAMKLLDRHLLTGSVVHLYAFLGAVAGIAGAQTPDREADWRVPTAALAKLQRYFPLRPGSEDE